MLAELFPFHKVAKANVNSFHLYKSPLFGTQHWYNELSPESRDFGRMQSAFSFIGNSLKYKVFPVMTIE